MNTNPWRFERATRDDCTRHPDPMQGPYKGKHWPDWAVAAVLIGVLAAMIFGATGCGVRDANSAWDVRCPDGDEIRVAKDGAFYRDEQGRRRLFPQTCTWTEVKQ
jgi:hypothetical protein